MKLLLLTCLAFSTFLRIQARKVSYEGYSLHRIVPKSVEEIYVLEDLAETAPASLQINKPTLVLTSPAQGKKLLRVAKELDLSLTTTSSNVQRLIDAQLPSIHHDKLRPENFGLDTTMFHNLSSIYNWMASTRQQFPTRTELINIGSSYENRTMWVLKVNGTNANPNKRAIWLDCTIHAREWIAPAICTYALARLLEDYNTDATTKTIVDLYDWYVLPVLNPDGYDYTWTTNRMWRKTRSSNGQDECIGTDGNRNYAFMWDLPLASTDPCSEIFKGSAPFSEVETRAASNFLVPTGNRRFQMAINYHSYGQEIILPWAHTRDPRPDDFDELKRVADAGAADLYQTHQQVYTVKQPQGYYSGFSIDWQKANASIPYSYLVELRDTGLNGFLLPPEEIRPTCEENWAAIKAMASRIRPTY